MKKIRVNIITDYDEDTKEFRLVRPGTVIRITRTFLVKAGVGKIVGGKGIVRKKQNFNIAVEQEEEYE